MGKAILFLVGLAAGAAGATAWILGEVPGASVLEGNAELNARLHDVQHRLEDAMAEGERAGRETEDRLNAELRAYRRGNTA